MLVGIDLGGTKIAVAIADRAGQIVSCSRYPTEKDDLVGSLVRAVVSTATKAEVALADIQAIGVGVPGMINSERGAVELAVNLQITETLPLAGLLSVELNAPVKLENDVRLAALGAYQHVEADSIAYLSIGTGIAAGVVHTGELWRGANNMAGELGHLVLDDSGTIVEQRAAGPAIVRQANAAGLTVEHAGQVYQLAAQGDQAAFAVIQAVSRQLARLLQWTVLAYDVTLVVIGGGVTTSAELFLKPIYAELSRLRAQAPLNAKLLPESRFVLLPAGVDAGLVGAVWLAGRVSAETRPASTQNRN